MVGTWELLGSASGGSGTMSVSFTTGQENLFVQFQQGTNVQAKIQYNDDDGSNQYSFRRDEDGTEQSVETTTYIRNWNSGSATQRMTVMQIANQKTKKKEAIHRVFETTSGADEIGNRMSGVSEWNNTTAKINKISFTALSGSFDSSDSMTVWGASDDDVDEKTTLADATVTTDSPSTTTTTTSGATQQGAQSGSNQTTAHVTIGSNTGLKFTSTHSGTGAAVGTFDLGSALASKWIAQVSFTTGSGYTSSGNGMFAFGISDKSTYSSSEHMNTNSSGDTVNWIWHLGASNDRTQRIRTILNGSGSDGSNGTSRAWEDSTTFYFEMSYDGSTVTAQRKTDDTYATNHSQSAITKSTSGITGLQYFNWGSTDDGGSQGGFNVTLNTLKIYDDTDSLTTTSSLAPPANTRYEEVDTRKIYRFTSSGTQSAPLFVASPSLPNVSDCVPLEVNLYIFLVSTSS